MTREELFRAVGEVREDQIEAAEAFPKRQTHPWRKFGALAACLALLVTAASAVSQIRGQLQWKAIVGSFQAADHVEQEADAGGSGDLDGCEYWSGHITEPLRPNYSTGVEIGELAGPGDGEMMMSSSACLAWLEPEEIFEQDTVIFRGTVRDLQYYQVEIDGTPMKLYFTRAIVEVTDSIQGGLAKGETYALLYVGAKGYMSTSISGPLEDLDVGSDAIFMPSRTDQDTGWKEGNGYFCSADLADFYLSEGMRYVFADTGEGLNYERNLYPPLETLDEAAAYIREMTGESEKTQRAVIIGKEAPESSGGYVFVEGTEPPKTAEAGPKGALEAPNGAGEIPGGAYAGDEKTTAGP